MSLRYPFTDLKDINWPAKKELIRPLIISAQNAQDTLAYVQTFYEYLYEIPDGHISLSGNLDQYKQQKLAGTCGFNMIPADDGSVLVSYIYDESQAYASGLRTADRILRWNDIAIDSLLIPIVSSLAKDWP